MHLPEADRHLDELDRLFTAEEPEQHVVLQETDTCKLIIKSSVIGTCKLIEYRKRIRDSTHDNFKVTRISSVMPYDGCVLNSP